MVGAPFLYLLTCGPSRPATQPREGTIWYPFHGWEEQHIIGDHRRLIDEIRRTEPGPVTFCLYWNEFRNTEVRAALYERAGPGRLPRLPRPSGATPTPQFLDKQLAELRRHRRVASNRLSSAVFYGDAAGCEPASTATRCSWTSEDRPTADRIRRQWPELHGTHPDPAAAYASAMSELGGGHLASPGELRAMFGWSAA